MRLGSSTRTAYRVMLGAVLLGGAMRRTHFVGNAEMSFACYVTCLLVWARLAQGRFLHRGMRRCIVWAAGIMIAWLFVRTVKYDFAFESLILSRYLWYSYYLGFLFTPTLLLMAVLHLGKRLDEGVDRRTLWLLLAGAGLLFALVMTNDLHQLAFRFLSEDRSRWTSAECRHGLVYYLSYGWTFATAIAAVAISLVQGRRQRLARALAPVVILLLLALCYTVCYFMFPKAMTLFPYQMVEATCILIVAYFECLVLTGLVPVNDHHLEFWQQSSLRGGFLDGAGRLAHVSESAPPVTPEQVQRALARPLMLDDGDEQLTSHAVCGGVVWWVRDLGHVHELQDQLQELGDLLEGENTLLAAENELAREKASVAQREQLYRAVVAQTASQLKELGRRLEQLPQDDAGFVAGMREAALLLTYLKRSANLMFVGEHGTVDVQELALALQESCSWLQSCGVTTTMACELQGSLSTEVCLRAYERFEEAVEAALGSLCELCVCSVPPTDGVPWRLALDLRDRTGVVRRVTVSLGGEAV